MHLAFLTPEYPHPHCNSSGGLGTSIKNMVTTLVTKGVKISLFIYDQQTNETFIEGGIIFYIIRKPKFKFLGWYLHRKFLQEYLNQAIIQNKIDAIEAPDWTGITAFMNLKCPLVIRLNGSDTYFCHLDNRPQKKKNYWFEREALRGTDHILSVSKFTAQKTTDLFRLKKKIEVIPNSVDIKLFSPPCTEVEPYTILYFGSIIRKKGVLELADIFNLIVNKNPKARITFAGRDVQDYKTGNSTKQMIIAKLTPEARNNTTWLGELPYDKVLRQVVIANVVVLPSFAEALPMTWIEAMAMEKALVTSDIGWAKEVMVNGVTGFTVNPKNHLAYSEKILQLISDPTLTRQMGKAAREQVKTKFSADVITVKNIEFYKKIIKKHF
jgi:L-malate glycosyltransferase